jgi:hypothetical protein
MRRLLTCASALLLGTAWIGYADVVVRFADAPYPPYVVEELTISLYPFPRALKMVDSGRESVLAYADQRSEGRVDYIAEDEAVAEAIMADNGWQERTGWLHEPLPIYTVHAAVSRHAGYAHLLSRMNVALEELRRGGRCSELVPSPPSDHR